MYKLHYLLKLVGKKRINVFEMRVDLPTTFFSIFVVFFTFRPLAPWWDLDELRVTML